jgi:hypothetical protein
VLLSKAKKEAQAEVLDTLQETISEETQELFDDLEARASDNETVSAVRALAEHHLSKASDAISAGVTGTARKISAFVRDHI